MLSGRAEGVLLLAIAGCSTSDSLPSTIPSTCPVPAAATSQAPLCSRDGWCWENPRPYGDWLRSVGGASADDLWAVGGRGFIRRRFHGVWQDVPRCVDDELIAVFGSAADDLWIFGAHGSQLRWNGEALEIHQRPATGGTTRSWRTKGWSSGHADAWASSYGYDGSQGVRDLIHFDGHAWSPVLHGPRGALAFFGRAPDDLYAASDLGTLSHFDGVRWSDRPVPLDVTFRSLTSVWGEPGGGLWIGGVQSDFDTSRGMLYQVAGDRWTENRPGPGFLSGSIHQIVGEPGGGLWAVALTGEQYRWDGAGWSEFRDGCGWYGTEMPASTLWSGPGGATVSVGCRTREWDGSAWQERTPGPRGSLDRILTTPGGQLWAWGSGSPSILAHRDAASVVTTEEPGWAVDLWAAADDDVWTVGDDLRRFDGRAWRSLARPTDQQLTALWGSGPDDVWVAAYRQIAGTLLHRRGGGAWTEEATTHDVITQILGTGPGSVFAATGQGQVTHFDGATWTTAAQLGGGWSLSPPLTRVGPSGVWLVERGYSTGPVQSRVLRWSGKAFDVVVEGPAAGGTAAVWGASEDDVWLVGDAIRHFDGRQVTLVTTVSTGLPDRALHAVWGRARDDVWAVGDEGTIWHYDGAAWSERESGSSSNLYRVGGAGGVVWAVGAGGTILSLGRP